MLLALALIFGLFAGADPQPGAPDAMPEFDVRVAPVSATLSIPHTMVAAEPAQQRLLDLINRDRAKAGLKSLQWDAKLAQAARDHADRMTVEGRLSHQFVGEPDLVERLKTREARFDAASENVVYDVTAEGAHEAFANSARHLENMMNASYDAVGIAVVNQGGVLYVVEDFAHRMEDLSDVSAAQHVAERFAQLRNDSGLPSLPLVDDAQLNPLVDQMVQREAPDSHLPLTLPGARLTASYATVNPEEIPATVARLAAFRGASSYAVSVRFARTARYPTGLFWVSIVMFDDSRTLARR